MLLGFLVLASLVVLPDEVCTLVDGVVIFYHDLHCLVKGLDQPVRVSVAYCAAFGAPASELGGDVFALLDSLVDHFSLEPLGHVEGTVHVALFLARLFLANLVLQELNCRG